MLVELELVVGAGASRTMGGTTTAPTIITTAAALVPAGVGPAGRMHPRLHGSQVARKMDREEEEVVGTAQGAAEAGTTTSPKRTPLSRSAPHGEEPTATRTVARMLTAAAVVVPGAPVPPVVLVRAGSVV
jgi:hypothetical protein